MSDEFKRHPEIDAILGRLKFFHNSYLGGASYKAGQYLKKHKREDGDDYTKRLDFASFRNFCAPIVDIYTSYLYREEPTRNFGKLENEIEEFMEDADFEKNSYNEFIKEFSKHNGTFGMMGLIVDKPQSKAITKQQEKDNDIRPYLVAYNPLQFIQIAFERINGKPTLTKVVLEEDSGKEHITRYRVWYPDSWEVWEKDTSSGSKNSQPVIKESGNHTLGEIPFILAKNRKKLHKIIGLSDIEDICDINRRIYNLDSDADEIMLNCGFPFLEIFEGTGGSGEVQFGTGNVLERDGEDSVGSRWVEPAHSSLPNILAWRNQAVEDIREMAKTGKVTVEGQQAESGIALEIRFDQLNALLSDKAKNMKKVEEEIFRLFGKWQGIDWDGDIEYPNKFGVRDLEYDIEIAIQAAAAVPSRTFDAIMGRKIAARVLKEESEEVLDQIEAELRVVESPPTEEEIEEDSEE